MTAPDPGLTDLIAAEVDKHAPDGFVQMCIPGTNSSVDHEYCVCDEPGPHVSYSQHVAEDLKLVVEQHTSGRITELYEQRDSAIEAGLAAIDRAEKAEATIARVEKLAQDMRGWCSPHGISVTYSDRILAALEGEHGEPRN